MLSDARRLLVVDDDPEWVEAITDFLREEGYDVASAPNGAAALEALSRGEPTVVITDIRMPVMDGMELLSRCREEHARVPVIVVSGENAERDDPGLEGAFRVIPKPVPVEELLCAIGDAVRRATPAALQVARRARDGRFSCQPGSRFRRLVGSLRSSAPSTRAMFLTFAVVTSLAFLSYWRTRIS